MKDGAVVVLHDISLEHDNSLNNRDCFVNQIPFL